MNISGDKSADYFQPIEGPLCKKSSIDKMDTSNDELLLSLSRSNNSNRENVIENNGNESTASKINITNKIKNLKNSSNIYIKKLSIKSIPNSGINSKYLSSSKKECCQGLLYSKKSNSSTNLSDNNFIKDYKTSSSSYRKNKETKDSLGCDSITSNSKIVNENVFISPKKGEKINNLIKNCNLDKKKGLLFIKKVKKNKKFVIDKKKLFNKNFEKMLKDSIYKKNKTNEIMTKSTRKEESSLLKSNYIYFGGDNSRINININKNKNSLINGYKDKLDKFSQENSTNSNSKQNDDIKTIFYDAYFKKCNDSIKTIKDQMKKRNFLSINKRTTKNLVIKNNEIRNDFQRDDCCISCT
jgi:hypothetical protein